MISGRMPGRIISTLYGWGTGSQGVVSGLESEGWEGQRRVFLHQRGVDLGRKGGYEVLAYNGMYHQRNQLRKAARGTCRVCAPARLLDLIVKES
jgi:hypothetical protein